MSNNLVSQNLSIPSMQMGQLEPILNKVDSSVQDMQMGLMGSVSNVPAAHQHSITNKPVGLMDPFSSNPGFERLSMTSIQTVGREPNANNLGLMQFIPNKQPGPMETMLNHAGYQQLSASNKRKAPVEPLHNNISVQELFLPNKRVAQLEHRPWLQQASGPNQSAVQTQYLSNTPGSQRSPTPVKKVVYSKSGSQRFSIPKNQTAALQPTSKGQTESFESVRSKMRESLAGALALVSQQKDKSSSPKQNSHSDSASVSGQTQKNSQLAGSLSAAIDAPDSASVEPKVTLLSRDDRSAPKSNNGESESARISAAEANGDFTHTLKSAAEANCDFTHTLKFNGHETRSSYVLPGEDVSFIDDFFAKDELLQGNGLSWVLDSEMQVAEKGEFHTAQEQKLVYDDMVRGQKEEAFQSPQIVAFKIEAELFKLFGGVNKKYKEKGRSLLFNLKDRNNPELRERVMSGDIPPERLCSMTAEELASEELSQWRIAKAEELAQMVVLPDAEVDIRRLVKKTHKGEFQVEIEQDDSVPTEVSVGASSFTRRESDIKEMDAPHPSKRDEIKDEVDTLGEESNLEVRNIPYMLSIPSRESTDLMQGLVVDDALKDAEFLPPIVSLDEFMESLDSEPPFENLPVDAGKITPNSDKDGSEPTLALKSSESTLKDDITTDEPVKVDVKYSKSDAGHKFNEGDAGVKSGDGHADMKPSDSHTDVKYNDGESVIKSNTNTDVNSSVRHAEVKSCESYADFRPRNSHAKSEVVPPTGVSKGDHVWEGSLQLNTSAKASVVSIFKSGERTSAKEWPSSLEIKGRVRLDAFEKFLQELSLSRSRAVMVMHFVLVEGSSESEHAGLREVADSYVLDERVGFSEPAPGVELYFCPPQKRTREMLGNILPAEHIEALNNIDNGLIGVIVWRKAQLTSRISPNSSSHHKHKKQNLTSRRQQETNIDSSFKPKPPNPPRGLTPTNLTPSPDEDDDIPPGFGPRDEDDLPEFKFSGGSVSSSQRIFIQNISGASNSLSQTPACPVDQNQMRELVHKYGQPKAGGPSGNWLDNRGYGVAVQPWNDDDDDIPEWQPQQASQGQLPSSQQSSIHSFHQPMLRAHLVDQPPLGSAPQQPPHQGSTWWVPPVQGNSQQPSNLGCQPNVVGQFYGVPGRGVGQQGVAWRQNAPQNGGF
ncbi:hypothetical protein F2P56_026117 [Juglans regia]|uniref:Uncharacterized protein LOC109009624 isoform X1 n=2 Tax=Juglans regia TaxID=51240 RepID=A0A2I4GPC1_JUGRE|nr:uncharacterized protein LOC109009624 isoform X1 [Juglans regia]XP_018845747.2 uncharacterized protein LOC109009624 isoform X1 [Juglans regia]KAF5456665.1 hypothetical protein F2P56_026117 [Juglans regia]